MNRDFSQTAALLSDPGRAAMLIALLDGGTLPAGHLAMIGNIAPQTASSHLAKLVQGKLLTVQERGRHRYYRLANTEIAHIIEAMLAVCPPSTQDRDRIDVRASDHYLAYARTCYSHLAGRLAVEMAHALLQRRVLRHSAVKEFAVTRSGREWLAQLGIPLTEQQTKHRQFARCCLDWTERRYHIAGALGSALLNRFRELKWIAPLRDTRAVRITIEGQQGLYKLLQIKNIRCGFRA